MPLPKYPVPSHTTTGRKVRWNLSTVGTLIPIYRAALDEKDKPEHSLAPLRAVTVNNAIDDLVSGFLSQIRTKGDIYLIALQPKFEWANPHHLLAATEADRKEAARRARNFPAFTAYAKAVPARVVGFVKPHSYAHPPHHPYQAWSRRGMSRSNAEVSHQYTATYSLGVVER